MKIEFLWEIDPFDLEVIIVNYLIIRSPKPTIYIKNYFYITPYGINKRGKFHEDSSISQKDISI